MLISDDESSPAFSRGVRQAPPSFALSWSNVNGHSRVLRRYKRTLVSGQISAVYCGILFDFNSSEIKLVFTVQLKMAPIRYVLIGCIYFDV